MTDFSRLGALKVATYSVKVVVSKKWSEIDTLLLHTTNKKYHMAYPFVQFPMTLDDLEGHSPNAGLIKCNSTNICATFSTVLTMSRRVARFLGDSWASCFIDSQCNSRCQVAPSRFNSVAGTLMILAAYCNMFLNPLIYVAQYDVVRRPLASWVKCSQVASQQSR